MIRSIGRHFLRRLLASSSPLLLMLAPLFGGSAAAQSSSPVLINEVVVDSRGSNLTELEFIELHTARPSFPLGGLSVISVLGVPVEETGLKPGYVLHSIPLPADAKSDSRGFYLLANERAAKGYNVVVDLPLEASGRLTNEPQTLALVKTSEAPRKGDSITPATRFPSGVFDAVAVNDANTRSSFFFGAPVVGPDREFLAAGAARVRDGVNTGDKSDWFLADIDAPPQSYNTPRMPNRAGDQVVMVDARTPTAKGAGASPTPTPGTADSGTAGGVKWINFDPNAVEFAVQNQGSALVYARSATFRGCLDFERNYLLTTHAQPLLASRPTFFLNVNIPGNGRFASDMGIYKVPTLAFRRRGGAWEYLIIDSSATPESIKEFLSKR